MLACTGVSAVSQVSFIDIPLMHWFAGRSWFVSLVLPLQGLLNAILYRVSLPFPLIASGAPFRRKEATFRSHENTYGCLCCSGFLLVQHIFAAILKHRRLQSSCCITAVSIPLCAIHSCINSYYYARKKPLFGSRTAFGAVCTDRHYLYPVSDLSFEGRPSLH